jgi:NitT/TauT family transport system substrate-binding protein
VGVAADGVPVKIVLATQIAEAQIVALEGSPIKTVGDLKGKKIGMSPPGSATHAIATAILDHNFGLKANDYSIAPGNEPQLAQFLSQKEIDAGVLRSVTLAQMDEVKLRKLGSVVDEWKKLTKGNAPPILAVTIVYNDYLAKNAESVAKFIAATRNALEYGSKNKPRVAEILQKAANMNGTDARAYANQWDGAYIASFEPADVASLKRMYDIVKAAGGATKDAPDSVFDSGPYLRAKKIK